MELTGADGYAERDAAMVMLDRLPARKRRRTVAGDKGYDTKDFVARARQRGFTPQVAQHTTKRRSAIDGRTTRHGGYAASLRIRKRIEEPFGWIKTTAGPATRFPSDQGLPAPPSRSTSPPFRTQGR